MFLIIINVLFYEFSLSLIENNDDCPNTCSSDNIIEAFSFYANVSEDTEILNTNAKIPLKYENFIKSLICSENDINDLIKCSSKQKKDDILSENCVIINNLDSDECKYIKNNNFQAVAENLFYCITMIDSSTSNRNYFTFYNTLKQYNLFLSNVEKYFENGPILEMISCMLINKTLEINNSEIDMDKLLNILSSELDQELYNKINDSMIIKNEISCIINRHNYLMKIKNDTIQDYICSDLKVFNNSFTLLVEKLYSKNELIKNVSVIEVSQSNNVSKFKESNEMKNKMFIILILHVIYGFVLFINFVWRKIKKKKKFINIENKILIYQNNQKLSTEQEDVQIKDMKQTYIKKKSNNRNCNKKKILNHKNDENMYIENTL